MDSLIEMMDDRMDIQRASIDLVTGYPEGTFYKNLRVRYSFAHYGTIVYHTEKQTISVQDGRGVIPTPGFDLPQKVAEADAPQVFRDLLEYLKTPAGLFTLLAGSSYELNKALDVYIVAGVDKGKSSYQVGSFENLVSLVPREDGVMIGDTVCHDVHEAITKISYLMIFW